MIMPHILHIASSSASRKKLLENSKIPFIVIDQDADESQVSTDQELSQVVMQISQLKMAHVKMSAGKYEGDICFVLTADTLGVTTTGRVLCKPVDRNDAISMLKDSRLGNRTITGFCLCKFVWQNSAWVVVKKIVDFDEAWCVFDVSDEFLYFYLDNIPFLSVSGAISIESTGGQFLKTVNGSYETVIGLPMFKIRQALLEFGFYRNE